MKGLNGIIIRVSGVRVPPPLLVPGVASGRTTPPKSATGRDLGGFVCARMGSAASQRLARSDRVSRPARFAYSDEDLGSGELNAGAGHFAGSAALNHDTGNTRNRISLTVRFNSPPT